MRESKQFNSIAVRIDWEIKDFLEVRLTSHFKIEQKNSTLYGNYSYWLEIYFFGSQNTTAILEITHLHADLLRILYCVLLWFWCNRFSHSNITCWQLNISLLTVFIGLVLIFKLLHQNCCNGWCFWLLFGINSCWNFVI